MLGRYPFFYPLLSFSGECLLFVLRRVCVGFFSASPSSHWCRFITRPTPTPYFELFQRNERLASEARLNMLQITDCINFLLCVLCRCRLRGKREDGGGQSDHLPGELFVPGNKRSSVAVVFGLLERHRMHYTTGCVSKGERGHDKARDGLYE